MRDKSRPQLQRFLRNTSLSASLILASGLAATPASAACKMLGCACLPSEIQFASPTMQPNEDGQYAISLEADDVSAQGQDIVTLSGNAEVSQGRQTIVADQLKYYRNTERVVASGNVEMISENGDYLSSESIDVHAPTQIGQLVNSQFKLSRGIRSADGIDTALIDSRGSADRLNLEGEGILRLEKAKYTTCPEGDESVMISAKELELDQNAGVGKARGAVIRFKGLPIFYTPYISFPINDERKTGFLTPGYGSDEESGNIVEFPWYWNIAKNQDATITPRYYSDRGLQVGAEYRLRTQSSSTYVYGEVLPDDELFGDDRDLLTINHFQQFTDNLSGKVNYNDVSDVDYFDDLRNDVRYFSASYVPRDIRLDYNHDYFTLTARANEYQIIDDNISEERKPYERLPSLSFSTSLPKGPMGMKYGMYASHTNFSSDFRVEGTRTALDPYVSIPFENLWGYVKPALSVHHRKYSLDNRAEGLPSDPSFTVPILSVDAGLYFEKNSSWFGDSALHTLEPRIFYAYAEDDEDQNDAPIFDTSQVSLNNFSNIFRANRFYGSDRVGDTNQVTFGLTTRIIDNETGDQRLKASIGQLLLIDDLQQNLRSSEPIESGLGDFLAAISTESKGSWGTSAFVQYDHEESEVRAARVAFGYEPKDDNRKRITVDYYYSNGFFSDVEQVTLNMNWPVSDKWQFFGSESYSIEDKESRSTNVGLEYNSCCWKLRVIGQDRISNRNSDDDNRKASFFIELELTSFGSIRSGL